MATGHFFLTNNSPGAPSLTNAVGTLISVLDFILDTAGGTHWEKVYTGTNTAVFRATTGQRYYLRVDDNIGQVARFVGYETMSDVDTGTNPFPSSSTDFGYVALPKNDAAPACDWWAVGDSRFFMLIVNHDPTYPITRQILAFGEATPIDPLDAYCTMLLAANHNNTTAVWNQWSGHGINSDYSGVGTGFPIIQPSACGLFWANQPDGLNDSVAGMPFQTSPVRNANGLYSDQAVIPIAPVYISSGNGDAVGSIYYQICRARFPYLSTPFCQYGTGANDLDDWVIGSDSYRLIAVSTSTAPSGVNAVPYLVRTSNNEPGRV